MHFGFSGVAVAGASVMRSHCVCGREGFPDRRNGTLTSTKMIQTRCVRETGVLGSDLLEASVRDSGYDFRYDVEDCPNGPAVQHGGELEKGNELGTKNARWGDPFGPPEMENEKWDVHDEQAEAVSVSKIVDGRATKSDVELASDLVVVVRDGEGSYSCLSGGMNFFHLFREGQEAAACGPGLCREHPDCVHDRGTLVLVVLASGESYPLRVGEVGHAPYAPPAISPFVLPSAHVPLRGVAHALRVLANA